MLGGGAQVSVPALKGTWVVGKEHSPSTQLPSKAKGSICKPFLPIFLLYKFPSSLSFPQNINGPQVPSTGHQADQAELMTCKSEQLCIIQTIQSRDSGCS